MLRINRDTYVLLLSSNPCEVFEYFNVEEMHGLSLKDCREYNNTPQDSYMAGLCNVDPHTGQRFIFINLSRCPDDIRTMGLAMHETMHLAFSLFTREEEIITYAEIEAYKIIEIINNMENELLSDCCGVSSTLPEMGICPDCLEHCEFTTGEE